jgi:hypothetical protein
MQNLNMYLLNICKQNQHKVKIRNNFQNDDHFFYIFFSRISILIQLKRMDCYGMNYKIIFIDTLIEEITKYKKIFSNLMLQFCMF